MNWPAAMTKAEMAIANAAVATLASLTISPSFFFQTKNAFLSV
jgi:hypothetical protein